MHLKHRLGAFFLGLLVGAAGAYSYFSRAAPAPVRAASVASLARFETFGLRLPTLGLERSVRVYLPPNYYSCLDCRYPVIYFMDGQNVFDAATSFTGEWGADETLDALFQKHALALIAVAIDHGGEARMQELSVWDNARYGESKGAAFLNDLINTVKPAIDTRYRTQPVTESTLVAGSSMGGLLAHAAVMRHPQVFSRGLVFSPSYWFSSAIAEETRQTPLKAGQAVYLYVGGDEGGGMVTDAKAITALWQASLPPSARVHLAISQPAQHNEAAWQAALPEALRWSFAARTQPME
jgi:predicted alpha/beta superfamily hydrolase